MNTDVKPVPKQPWTSKVKYILAVLVLLAAAAILVLGVYNYIQNKRERVADEQQIAQTEELIRQVKNLSEQNKRLNQTSNNYAYCNAMLFSEFTRTGNPITVKDLNECIYETLNNEQAGDQQSYLQPAQDPRGSRSSTQSSTGSNLQPSAPTQPTAPNRGNQPQQNNSTVQVSPPLLPGIKLDVCTDLIGVVQAC